MKRVYRILVTLLIINLLCWGLPKLLRAVTAHTAETYPVHTEAYEGTHAPSPPEEVRYSTPGSLQYFLIPFELSFISPRDGSIRPHIHSISPFGLILWHLVGFGLLYITRRRRHKRSATA